MAVAHPKAKAGGGGSDAREVDAPSQADLDAMIADAREHKPPRNEVVSVRELAAKLGVQESTMRHYARSKGFESFWIRYDGESPAKYFRIEQAEQIIHMRIENGLL